jgi:hypothetical protein
VTASGGRGHAGDGLVGDAPTDACRSLAATSGSCVGHAVIVGIDKQARHGGELWYAAPLDVVRRGPALN